MTTVQFLQRKMFAFTGIAMLMVVPNALGSQIDATWSGGIGDWTNPANWNIGNVPNNTALDTYHVFIDGDPMSLSDASLSADVTIDALTVGTDDILRLPDGGTLRLDASVAPATVSGAGTIFLEATTGQATLVANGGDVTFSNGGLLDLSNNPGNTIAGAGANARLINEDWEISGAGQIGQDTLALINRGTITASFAETLSIDPNASGMINRGTMRAKPGGHLLLASGTINNSEAGIEGAIIADGGQVDIISATVNGGIAQVFNNGEVYLRSATLNGTVVVNSAGGTIRLPDYFQAHNAMLTGSFNNQIGGQVVVGNSGQLVFSGAGPFINDGEIVIEPKGQTTYMRFESGPVTVSGNGKIVLNTPAYNYIVITGSQWTNDGNTIEGSGVVNGVTNLGTITGNRTSPLQLQGTVTKNAGLIHAVDQGTVNLLLTSLTNSINGVSGIVRADDDGTVILDDVIGGIVEALSGGTLILRGDVTGAQVRAFSGGTIQGGIGASQYSWVTGGGTTVTIDDGAQVLLNNDRWRMTAQATYINNGTIKLGGTEGPGLIELWDGPVVISGTGEIDMSGNVNNAFQNGISSSTLTLNQYVHGTGTIARFSRGGPITNLGTISADDVTPLTIRISYPPFGGPLYNNGALIVSGTGGMTISGGGYVYSNGEILVLPGSVLSQDGHFYLQSGIMVVDGALVNLTNAPELLISVSGAKVSGNGTIGTRMENTGGTVAPGSSTGILTLTKDFNQSVGGTLEIEIGGLTAGTEYDRLTVSGTANLGGTLSIELVNSFTGNIGDTFTIMTYAAKTGDFDAIDAPCLPGGVRIAVTVGPTSVIAEIAAPLASDINCDCASTLDDAEALALALLDPDAFAKLYDPCDVSTADVNGDMFIDGFDIQAFLDAFLP